MGGVAGNSALPLVTTDGAVESDELGGDMRPTPWLQQCPCIMQVMDALGATWGRSRLMRLSGRSQLAAHVDTNYYWRSEEHTSELQSLMRISYAVFCLKKKNHNNKKPKNKLNNIHTIIKHKLK